MSGNTNAILMADPKTATLKRCCNMTGEPLKMCACSSGSGTASFTGNLYGQQWIIDVDAGSCTYTGGFLIVNHSVMINLACK